jgi:hypothetical protein
MLLKTALFIVVSVCLWGVLNPRLKTRTLGTMALSLIALLAVVELCR